jgi:uncharacterized membrane protein YdbT with pleckstrin-like domain
MVEIGKENKLSSKVIKFHLLKILLPAVFLFLTILPLIFVKFLIFLILFLLLSLFFLAILLYFYLYIKNFSFYLDEEKIQINSGILFKKSVLVPFDKIQTIKTTQNIFQRLFDIKSLNIWTASPSQIDISKEGSSIKTNNAPDIFLELEEEDIQFISDFIFNKKKKI